MAKLKKKQFPVEDLPEVEEMKGEICYKNIRALKASGVELPMTKEQVDEIKKVYTDIHYFANNYMMLNTKKGVTVFKPREYQTEIIDNFSNNRFNIVMMGRQMGKCVSPDTIITVRNTKTGEVIDISIKELYDRESKQ